MPSGDSADALREVWMEGYNNVGQHVVDACERISALLEKQRESRG